MARKTLDDWIDDQIGFMLRCGGTLKGYINRYGVPETYNTIMFRGEEIEVPAWSGNGGEAIFNADLNQLFFLLDLKLRGRKYL